MTVDHHDDAPFPPPHDPEPGPPPPPPPPTATADDGLLPPWENRATHGYAAGFFESIRLAMTAPTRMFRGMTVTRGLWGPLTFYVLLYVFVSVMERLYSLAFSGMTLGMLSWMDELGSNDAVDVAVMNFFETVGVFFSPLSALISVFLTAAAIHVGALLIIPAKRGFEASFRAAAYAGAPLILSIVPVCGNMLVAPWMLVTMVIGMRENHRTSTGRAIAAVLVPLFAVICGFTLAVFVFTLATAAALDS